ncbi:MAG: S8 family serine peptidase [Oscillatoriales cyanobacterium C42_A2020_001]|nr:S8 family serine peptidase [Leptolyngbyaceae cyanobacterium C42_A2020_001]
MDDILASTSSPFDRNVGAGLTGTDGYGLSGALENRQLLATPLSRSRATNLTNLEIQNLLAEPTIVAIAQGNSTPPTARYPNTVTNGDFLLGGNAIATLVGDGLDEFTTWTFDLTHDPDFTDLTDTTLLASAELTLTLKTTFGIDTDGITIQGLGSIVKPIRELEAGKTDTITIDLLDYFSPDTVVQAIQTNGGRLSATYQDDAIVSFAQLELSTFDSGIFTVGETGEIAIDFLFDGGAYRGELALFSLEGMGQYKPGSEAFIEEATRRALTNSELGHVVISDRAEGARFSGALPYEGDFNAGKYSGVKAFGLRPGDQFGFMLIPDGWTSEVFENPNIGGSKRPIFSMSSASAISTSQFVQLVEVNQDALNQVDGNIFSFEDLLIPRSDRDYNDLIFQVRSATGEAPLLDTAIDPAKEWRNSGVGKKVTDYANLDGKGLTGRYYNNIDFTGYRGRRTDASVNFSWGGAAPAVMTEPETFSISWTGQIEPLFSETYTFYTKSDERVRLWVNGQLLIDNWTDHTLAENQGTITLTAGQKYDIRLEYAENTGDAAIQLLWSSTSQLKEVIPQNLLYVDPNALPLDPENGLEYAPGAILVKFGVGTTDEQIQSIAQTYGTTGIERFVPFRPESPSSLDQWRVLSFAPEANLLEIRNAARKNVGIEAIGFDYILEADAKPTELYFSDHQLWGLDNNGQWISSIAGISDADIDAPEAWDIQQGSRNVVVAVIDSGVDYTHLDLISNIWVNPKEIPNDKIDNDRNGYVDDVYGYDFGNKDSEPLDTNGHGTHVAGTIGATADNGNALGVSPKVSIMALKIEDNEGLIRGGRLRYLVRAIDYAIAENARIMNLSWKFTRNFWTNVKDVFGFGTSFAAATDAIRRANDAQVLFVTSAGNEGHNLDNSGEWKATLDLPNVITVAATNPSDQLDSEFSNSNYGLTTVDIGAPGAQIYSTVPGNSYAFYSGTSMAAPHVAGAAALLLAQNPFLTAAELRNILMTTADPVPDLAGKTVSGGRLNVYNALLALNPSRRVSLTINELKDIGNLDKGVGDPTDFYARVTFAGKDPQTTSFIDGKSNPKPNWLFFDDVTSSTVDFTIEILDEDDHEVGRGGDDRADINPSSEAYDLNLSYDMLTGEVINLVTGTRSRPGSDGRFEFVGDNKDDRVSIWFALDYSWSNI